LLIRHRLQPRESNICLGICMNHIWKRLLGEQ
jgi:hypothetical protein